MARHPKPWYWQKRDAWFVNIKGKRFKLADDKKAAFERFYELMREPVRQQVESRSLIAVIDAFLGWVQTNRSPDTYEWYRYRLQRFAEKYPDLATNALKPYHVEKWMEDYPHLSQTSRRNYLRSIKRCLSWAEKQGYVEGNPLEHLEVPGAERREQMITNAEYAELLGAIPDQCFRDLVVTTWETGCRPQESLRVDVNHFDLKNRRWVFPTKQSKGKKKPRIVYLTDEAFEITKRLAAGSASGALFRNNRGVKWTKDAVNCAFDRVRQRIGRAKLNQTDISPSAKEVDMLIPSLKPTRVEKGKRITKSDSELRSEAKRKLVARVIIKTIPRYSLYALRHAWATRALQSGLDGLTVAILMGHSDPSTLARVYQHLSHNPEHLLAQAAKVKS